jgi:hypothetical protein
MKPISVISSKAQLLKTFGLIPYPAQKLPTIEITGTVTRQENHLSIQYVVRGDIENILFSALTDSPARKDDLWRATCFEFFIAVKDQPQYWEFNMSPSSNWNVYAMDAYRQINMRDETAFTQLPFEFRKNNNEITLDISVDLNPIIQLETILELGIATIIQTNGGNESYWALAHPGPQADFHLRNSFTLVVE